MFKWAILKPRNFGKGEQTLVRSLLISAIKLEVESQLECLKNV